ncbi:MAG: sulfatase [Bacteroidota bacterium]
MKNLLLISLLITGFCSLPYQGHSEPPNIIVIFCDDLGYADLSCYGSLWNQTPEIDRMATEGVKFTDFYAGAPVCTPSRAGLMTGCYARRVDLDLDQDNRWVLFPKASKGINPEEKILPEMLKEAGYATAIIGKWHLGDQPVFFPTRHGFDYYFGIPYSNDMGTNYEGERWLPLMKNDSIHLRVNQKSNRDMGTLTSLYTIEAMEWIRENKDTPFFLYLAHTMPHNPVAASNYFHSKTNNPKQGFGASVAEISWSTGQILNWLEEQEIDNTLVIFTSDNGGAPHWGANNGILKGRKGQTFEGGVRVPFIAWWPGKIPPGSTCNAPASVLDFYPTFKKLSGIKSEDETKRDGMDISHYLFRPELDREPRPYFYWHVGFLQGVRYGNWKLNLLGSFTEDQRANISSSTYKIAEFADSIQLFNLNEDPGEQVNVAEQNPEIVKKLIALADEQKSALGEFTDKGPEVRRTVSIDDPVLILK